MRGYIIRFTDENGEQFYSKSLATKQGIIGGILVSYVEYELTPDMFDAQEWLSIGAAEQYIETMRNNRPTWFNSFHKVDIVDKESRRAFIAFNIRPLHALVRMLNGYKNANDEGKMNILNKILENDGILDACSFALKELEKYKKNEAKR